MSQIPLLERLFRRYSDLPSEVVVKEALLTEGMAPDAVLCNEPGSLPRALRLEGGIFGLRRTILRVAVREESPYLLRPKAEGDSGTQAGALVVVDRASGTEVAAAWPFPYGPEMSAPPFAGNPAGDIVSADGEVTAVARCELGGTESECRFCNFNDSARWPGARRPPPHGRGMPNPYMGKAHGAGLVPRETDYQRVAGAVAEFLLWPDWAPRERPVALRLTGGSIMGTVNGLSEEEVYLRHVEAIRDRVGHRLPLLLEMFPKSLAAEKRLWEAGVDARLSNLEIWDSRLFQALCPGKAQTVGWDEWIRRILDQVYVYGWNRVLPGLVIGLEMAVPGGFKDVKEAVASNVEGMRFLARHGVVPRPVHLRVDELSRLGGSPMPPVDLFLQVDRAWYEIFLQYGQDEPVCFLLGPGRSRYPDSAAFDVGRGAALASLGMGRWGPGM